VLTEAEHAAAKRYQTILGLDDWFIVYRVVSERLPGAMATSLARPDYREAVITVSLAAIEESKANGFEESVKRLLLHELCEVVVEECFRDVDTSIMDCDRMMRGRDIMADKLRRIVERMEGERA